eukprot:1433563-Pyramimonas_sp.AAC.2
MHAPAKSSPYPLRKCGAFGRGERQEYTGRSRDASTERRGDGCMHTGDRRVVRRLTQQCTSQAPGLAVSCAQRSASMFVLVRIRGGAFRAERGVFTGERGVFSGERGAFTIERGVYSQGRGAFAGTPVSSISTRTATTSGPRTTTARRGRTTRTPTAGTTPPPSAPLF